MIKYLYIVSIWPFLHIIFKAFETLFLTMKTSTPTPSSIIQYYYRLKCEDFLRDNPDIRLELDKECVLSSLMGPFADFEDSYKYLKAYTLGDIKCLKN